MPRMYRTHRPARPGGQLWVPASRTWMPSVRCDYCGDRWPCELAGVAIHTRTGHIVPVARGDGNDDDNLQVLCLSCNQQKADR